MPPTDTPRIGYNISAISNQIKTRQFFTNPDPVLAAPILEEPLALIRKEGGRIVISKGESILENPFAPRVLVIDFSTNTHTRESRIHLGPAWNPDLAPNFPEMAL